MKSQNGNVLFLILIAVALFAALSYAVTKSTSGGGNVSRETSSILAAELTQYAAEIQTAVMRMNINGVSDTNFCFDSALITTDKWYAGAPGCADDGNKVFHPDGGGVSYRPIQDEMLEPSLKSAAAVNFNQYGTPVISGRHTVALVGDNATPDLVFFAFYINEEICEEINRQLSIPLPTVHDYTCCGVDAAKHFNGSYGGQDAVGAHDDVTDFSRHTQYAGKTAGCADENGSGLYYYYHVLLAR